MFKCNSITWILKESKYRLQGTCFKGDSCEFSHCIDVQEVANKMIVPPPVVVKEPKFTPTDYPQLSTKTYISPQPTHAVQDEFPSLASASKIKKTPQSMIKGGHSINFAEAAKKKGSPKKVTAVVKKTGRRTGYINMQKLTQPVHIPWLDTGSALNSVYMKEVCNFFLYLYRM